MSGRDGGSAFPSEQTETQEGTWNQTYDPGMTLRDYFAAKVLQGMLANPTIEITDNSVSAEKALAEAAYVQADAMLTERERRDG